MKTSTKFILVVFFLFSVLCSLLSVANAAIPHLINYQGRLTDSSGTPLPTASYQLIFRIYDAETAGTLLWQGTYNVPVTKGIFSVLLGDISDAGYNFANLTFDKPYFLEINVGNEVMSPRQRIASVGYAIRAEAAETVNGKQASDLLNRANHTGTQPTSTITGTFAPSVISPQGAGSGLNADLLDNKDSSAFASSKHNHQCSYYNNVLPTGQTPEWLCQQNGQWCVTGLGAGGRDPIPCTSVNPGFSDWGAICCQ